MKHMTKLYLRGMRTSIRYNSSAFAYSIAITGTFGILQVELGSPRTPEIFAFGAGGSIGFAFLEALVSDFFRKRVRGDRSEVVVLGSALGIFAVTAALGSAWLVTSFLTSWVGWFVAPLCATLVFVAVEGLEMMLAEKVEGEDEG